MWRSLREARGLLLVGVSVVAILAYALGDQLQLYIHPRYLVFTVVMSLIAIALLVLAAVVRPPAHDDHDDEEPAPRWPARVAGGVAVALALALVVAMVVLPPTTLSSTTAQQRDINASALAGSRADVDTAAPVAAFASFTVLDWVALMRQTTDATFYADKPVDVTGFVAADPDDPANVFYVSRFIVTCCAVDAQPVGVAVYLPGWSEQFAENSWVQVTGTFVTNPSSRGAQPLVIDPASTTPIEQPRDPYLY